MSRSMTMAMETAVQSAAVKLAFFAEVQFVSTTVYLSTTQEDKSWNAHTWLGNGLLHDVRFATETDEIKATGAELSLSGLDETVMSLVLGDTNQTKKALIYLVLFDASNAIISDPLLIFKGNFDKAEIKDDGDGGSVTLFYENVLIGLTRQKEFRYTDQCQKSLFPTDRGFEYATLLEDWTGFWGKPVKPKLFGKKRRRKAKKDD